MRASIAIWLVLLGLLLAAVLPRTVPVTAQTADGLTSSCVELVQNGGFEQGATGWQTFSAQGYALISGFNPHTGSLGAYLGGVNNADDRLSQALTLPAGTTLTLKAWWYLATAETAGTFDTLTIALTAADGTPLVTLATLDNTALPGQWAELTFDVTVYAGQSVVLRFAARTDPDNISEFHLDDISLWAYASDPSPTPTATSTRPTDTATLTATTTVTRMMTATATATPGADATPSATFTPPPANTGTATPTGTAIATLRLYLPLIQR